MRNSRRRVIIESEDYRETVLEGKIIVQNMRMRKERIVISREFFGKFIGGSGDPKLEILPEGARFLNEKNRIIWDLQLKPKEKISLKYSYKILMDI